MNFRRISDSGSASYVAIIRYQVDVVAERDRALLGRRSSAAPPLSPLRRLWKQCNHQWRESAAPESIEGNCHPHVPRGSLPSFTPQVQHNAPLYHPWPPVGKTRSIRHIVALRCYDILQFRPPGLENELRRHTSTVARSFRVLLRTACPNRRPRRHSPNTRSASCANAS